MVVVLPDINHTLSCWSWIYDLRFEINCYTVMFELARAMMEGIIRLLLWGLVAVRCLLFFLQRSNNGQEQNEQVLKWALWLDGRIVSGLITFRSLMNPFELFMLYGPLWRGPLPDLNTDIPSHIHYRSFPFTPYFIFVGRQLNVRDEI